MLHGNRDYDRDLLRADSPSMKPEIFRMMFCFAVDHNYEVKSIDVKTAFLQTGKIDPTVYFIPPKEAGLVDVVWKLLKTVYCLADGPIKWFNHCRKTLLEFGLLPSVIDPTVYFLKSKKWGTASSGSCYSSGRHFIYRKSKNHAKF